MIRTHASIDGGHPVRKTGLLVTAAACIAATPALAQFEPPRPPIDADQPIATDPPATGDQPADADGPVVTGPRAAGDAPADTDQVPGTEQPPVFGADALVNPSSYGLPAAPRAPTAATVAGPPVLFKPVIGLQELYTDNAGLTADNHRSDFVTSPFAGAEGDINLGRLQAVFHGQYSYDWYARDSELNGDSVFANGGGTYTLLRDKLWIAANGTVTDGYTSTFGQSAVGRSGLQGRTQMAIYRVGPQFQTTIGGLVDFAAAADFSQIFFGSAGASTPLILPSSDNIYQVTARLDTGERLGRIQLLTTGQTEQDNHGFRTTNGVESLYVRVAPELRLIARAGYERVNLTNAVDISAPLLSAGFEYRPNPNSNLTLEGGQRYKRPAWAANANFKISRMLTVSASYRESIVPDQIFVAGSFAEFVATVASLPAPIVPNTLLPQENVYNQPSFNKSGVVTLNLQDPINQVVFTANYSERRFLTDNLRDRQFNGVASYVRQMRPDLRLLLTGAYGRTFASPLYGPSEYFGGTANLLYQLNSSTDLRGTYAYTQGRQLAGARTHYAENVVLIAIAKRF